MNSDPYDSAAWRAFGMLDADETSDFDDAMRDDPALRKYAHEMDRLAAAIAASNSQPIHPAEGQLEKLQNGLKLNPARRTSIWLAASGWAAAAAMAAALFLMRTPDADKPPVASQPTAAVPEPVKSTPGGKAATKRLTQEINVLRENLEKFQKRDRALFSAVPGIALPIVMTMNPPGVPAQDSPLTDLLGDSARWITDPSGTEQPASGAMAVYDAARDTGTLVVSDLPNPDAGRSYNLWVTTETGSQPIYVGSLPESRADGTVSFDFSLGSTTVLPSGFTLTIDPHDAPASPSESNTILHGPPPPSL